MPGQKAFKIRSPDLRDPESGDQNPGTQKSKIPKSRKLPKSDQNPQKSGLTGFANKIAKNFG